MYVYKLGEYFRKLLEYIIDTIQETPFAQKDKTITVTTTIVVVKTRILIHTCKHEVHNDRRRRVSCA